MAASATVLCNNVLIRAKQENIDVSPMKLQKLLYYVCVSHVKRTGRSPISEQFEVWRYGPVLPSVYAEFRQFGAKPIKRFASDASGKSQMVDEDYNPVLKSCIDYVWNMFKSYSGVALSQKTHMPGSGWYAAYQNNEDTITTQEMKEDCTIE